METAQTSKTDQGVQKGQMIFSYEGIMLGKDCLIKGKPCTARAISEWLEAKYPDKYVHKIIERNPHIKQYATRIKLTNNEGGKTVTREVKVFDAIGLQLIIGKSKQPKAIGFKIAVARLACDIMTDNLKAYKPKKTRADAGSFVNRPEFQQVVNYIKEHPGAGGKEIQAALGIPYSTSSINRWVRYIRGLPTPAPLPRGD